MITILDAHQRLVQQRREFLNAVRRYNDTIASYALAVAPSALSADRIVSMLLVVPATDRSVLASRRNASGIQRVSGEDGWTAPAGSSVRPQ